MKTQTTKRIKHLMIEKEVTGAEIARRSGVVRQAIYHVVAGRRKTPHLRLVIASALGLKPYDLWPDEEKAARKHH